MPLAPTTLTITALCPNMSRDELLRTVAPSGIAGRLRELVSPVRGVAEVYVPFHLYRVEIANRARTQTKQLAIDAVTNSLDLYEVAPEQLTSIDVSPRNVIPAAITAGDSQRALLDKVTRQVFRTGFFALRDVQLSASILSAFHVPYWVAMLGSERDLRLRVFDAVRRRREGAKVRALIREWLQKGNMG